MRINHISTIIIHISTVTEDKESRNFKSSSSIEPFYNGDGKRFNKVRKILIENLEKFSHRFSRTYTRYSFSVVLVQNNTLMRKIQGTKKKAYKSERKNYYNFSSVR